MLGRDQLRKLLEELADELEEYGVRADLFVVGGAAMALAYSSRRSTEDLDAIFEPKRVVRDAARKVASRHGLPDDWINDAVKGFLPGRDPNATVLFEWPSLRVRIASPQYLFAMKAAAARVERDAEDLRVLYRECGFRSVDESLKWVERFYPPHLLSPKTSLLLRELLSEFPSGRRRRPKT